MAKKPPKKENQGGGEDHRGRTAIWVAAIGGIATVAAAIVGAIKGCGDDPKPPDNGLKPRVTIQQPIEARAVDKALLVTIPFTTANLDDHELWADVARDGTFREGSSLLRSLQISREHRGGPRVTVNVPNMAALTGGHVRIRILGADGEEAGFDAATFVKGG
jgi:hypothetical protein